MHAIINVLIDDVDLEGNSVSRTIETTVGRILFNQIVPKEYGYINELLTKKSLRDIISKIMRGCFK